MNTLARIVLKPAVKTLAVGFATSFLSRLASGLAEAMLDAAQNKWKPEDAAGTCEHCGQAVATDDGPVDEDKS